MMHVNRASEVIERDKAGGRYRATNKRRKKNGMDINEVVQSIFYLVISRRK